MNLKRLEIFDIMRGSAVFFMIVSHLIAFTYSGENTILRSLQWIGDTIAFSIFLFVSSVVAYFSYISIQDELWQKKKRRYLKRLLWLYLGYLIVAIVSSLENFRGQPFNEVFNVLVGIVTLINPPDYSEFIVTFILFSLIIFFFRKHISNLFKSKYVPWILAILFYTIAIPLYYLNWGELLTPLKGLLVGTPGQYRFPILEYFPIFIFGLYFGRSLLLDNKFFSKQIQRETFLVGIFLILILLPGLRNLPYFENIGRWPPTLSFLTVGIFATLLIYHFFGYLPNLIKSFLDLLGQNTYIFFVLHITLLEMLDLLFDLKTNNVIIVVLLLPFTFLLLVLLSKLINNQLLDTLGQTVMKKQRR